METPGSVPAASAVSDTAGPEAAAAPAAAGVPARASGPVWRFLITPRWLGWHLFVVLAFWGMLWLGDWQFHRAMSGNGLSWAYTFEWPLFAGFGIVFWARTIRDEFRDRRGLSAAGTEAATAEAASGPALPEGIGIRPIERPADDADDADLASYNAYLARLNAEVKGRSRNRWRGYSS